MSRNPYPCDREPRHTADCKRCGYRWGHVDAVTASKAALSAALGDFRDAGGRAEDVADAVSGVAAAVARAVNPQAVMLAFGERVDDNHAGCGVAVGDLLRTLRDRP